MCAEYSPIPELNLLKEFDDADRSAGFSHGFEFHQEFGRDSGRRSWFNLLPSRAQQAAGHLEQLVPFARATWSGSFYALWKCDDRTDLATLPVVFFGDEGELSIVGRGLRDLFRLLAIDDENYDTEDPDAGQSPRHEEYCAWLETHFGLTRPDVSEPIVEAAMAEYAGPFADWLAEFLPEDMAEGLRAELEELREELRSSVRGG